jgi:hypothetical protein
MKKSRLKMWLLAGSGLFAFQVAGCNVLDQLRSLIPGLGS